MRTRVSPSFVVAVLALVLAAGTTGYAAGKVTSAQIKDGAVQSRDIRDGTIRDGDIRSGTISEQKIRNGTISGQKLRNRTIPRTKLDLRCAAGESALFGGCVRRTASGPTSHQAAIDDCNRRNGRLPSTLEIKWIAAHDEFMWADGNVSQYEFTGDYTGASPYTPIAFDRGGNSVPNASAQLFWHHCVTS